MVVMFTKAFAVIIGFPCMTILLTNSATSLRILGTLNGFATMFSGIGRAFGPAAAGASFSWGVSRGYVITAYWFLALTAVIGAVPIYMLVDNDALTQSPDMNDDDEDDEEEEEIEDDETTSESSNDESSGSGRRTETEPLLARNGGAPAAGYDAVSSSHS